MSCLACRFFIIDAFSTGAPNSGNPAAVVLLPPRHGLSDAALQRCAAEFNLSETAFVQQEPSAAPSLALRWFTPSKEVRLCGHGTLAAAHAVVQDRLSRGEASSSSALAFETLSGQLRVVQRGAAAAAASASHASAAPAAAPLPSERASSTWALSLPSGGPLQSPSAAQAAAVASLSQLLLPAGCGLQLLGSFYSAATKKLLLQVAGPAAALAALRPDCGALLAVQQQGCCAAEAIEGVCVTAEAEQGGGQGDFLSRYWSPWNGLPGGEDPANGSSHTALSPLWSQLLGTERELSARILSARGGCIRVQQLQAGAVVQLTGQAVTVAEGTVLLV
jgi:predicted PhzF superfamily epimerase YddE/YHI9